MFRIFKKIFFLWFFFIRKYVLFILKDLSQFRIWPTPILLVLTEINPEYSLEGLMLKLQYFGHLMQRADSLEKTLMLGKIEEEKETTEDEMVGWDHRLNGHEFESTPGFGAAVHGFAKSQTRLSD